MLRVKKNPINKSKAPYLDCYIGYLILSSTKLVFRFIFGKKMISEEGLVLETAG
jgi:hypothetical protein